jgi:hypothetical protein
MVHEVMAKGASFLCAPGARLIGRTDIMEVLGSANASDVLLGPGRYARGYDLIHDAT